MAALAIAEPLDVVENVCGVPDELSALLCVSS
jgi:hypothetical protein